MDSTAKVAAVCAQVTPAQLAKAFQAADGVHARARTDFQKATLALHSPLTDEQAAAYGKQLLDMIQTGKQADSLFAMTQICQRVKEGLKLPDIQSPSLRKPVLAKAGKQ